FAAGDFRRQRVQLRLPETTELPHPPQHRLKSRWINRIEPSLRVCPDLREVTLAQNLEVLRHRRLRDPELRAYCLHHFARGHLPGTDQFENAAANRVGQDLKGV